MDGKSREEALEVVGDVPTSALLLLERGNV